MRLNLLIIGICFSVAATAFLSTALTSFTSCNVNSSGNSSSSSSSSVNVNGTTWTVTYDWTVGLTGSSSFNILFGTDGKFYLNGGSTNQGAWTQSGSTITWTYTNSTVYTGTVYLGPPNTAEGTMTYGTNSGTWNATED